MRFLVLTVALVAAVSARPDVSSLPSGSYLPGGGSSILGGGYDSGIGIGGGNIGGSIGIGGGSIGIGGGHGGGGYSDQRHVYFYAAPDDEQASRLRINIVPSGQRNTKIIFVKAPSAGAVIPEVIAPPSQSEDKTLVYVLVKKQDQGGAITIPASATVKQGKPEVYFIKYRSQHDAEQQISSSLGGQHAGSSVPDVGNENSFVRTLDYGTGGGIRGGNGFIGGGGDFGGSSILGGSIGGGSIGGGLVSGSGRYGPPGVSGPYKR